ncbi:hypothetical protein SAMN05444157_1620 [Frankineae bacterium MT45]|nr:hypothetical protein SAMN05444157_1620 [Frankineae bacterium MT45]
MAAGKRARSSDAVTLDTEPVTTEQTADNTSTGAVEYAAPGETVVEHIGADIVVVAPTPGPVTMTVSWLSDGPSDEESETTTEAKVIEAPATAAVETSDATVVTK